MRRWGERALALALTAALVLALTAAMVLTMAAPARADWVADQRFVYRAAADVLGVYDADTFQARVYPWPGESKTVWIRVRGIDAPEISRRTACEHALGRAATAAARAWFNRAALRGPGGQARIALGAIEYGTFTRNCVEAKGKTRCPRMVARVYGLSAADNLGAALIRAGHARRYHKGELRGPWPACEREAPS